MTAVTAQTWTCDRCRVSAKKAHGERAPLPEAWVSSDEGCFCLGCRRERAAEAALEAAPEDCNRDARAKLRRASLIEFEVRRVPDRADNIIARACRTSPSAISAVRRRMAAR